MNELNQNIITKKKTAGFKESGLFKEALQSFSQNLKS